MARSAELTPLALAALEVLHEGPAHPYEICQTMRARQCAQLMKVTPGSLYHTIERLARDGHVEVVETSREGRRPERTTYRMTTTGQEAFADRLREITAEPGEEYPRFAVAVAYLHTLPREDALIQLYARSVLLASKAAALRATQERLAAHGLPDLYWIEVRYKLTMVQAELDWVDELHSSLTSGKLAWPTGTGTGSTAETEDVDEEAG